MTATVPLPLVSALLELERAVGRLAEAVRDPARRERLWADAARRDAVAAARLDGAAVDPTDFLVATVAPELVPPTRRSTGIAAHALWSGVRLAQGKMRRPAPPPPFELTAPAGPKTGPLGAASAAWRAVAELEAADDVDAHFAEDEPAPVTPLPEPWTVGWLERLWCATQNGVSGRAADRFPPHEERQAGALLDRVDGLLGEPGMVGGIEALGYLLRPAPVARVAPWAVPLARLVAPALLARAARVPEVWLPAAPVLLAERTAARLAAGGADLDWRIWLAGALTAAAHAERRRADALDAMAAGWRQNTGTRRRNSRLPEVLDGLFEHPAFTVRRLQRRFATTFRGAQLIVDDLVEAGVVREVTQRALDRVYVAVDLMP
ncbi:hypothetical protein [Azospirillum sp. TSO22-1]|uniref:hypothetical protein n=1 Tax=Azospirillum sp. TSO22-1 TaxID=716789 RepID=UPI000D61B7ED|nr:hypothetical protein [Azospirillum sp. TSO22-1]PWC42828.1 hypothetical protein TSO221_21110 [Azospirillum sp. TSO22-1]